MEQLIKGKAVKGRFYVHPASWTGTWDKDENLEYGTHCLRRKPKQSVMPLSLDTRWQNGSGNYGWIPVAFT